LVNNDIIFSQQGIYEQHDWSCQPSHSTAIGMHVSEAYEEIQRPKNETHGQ
jgi:hypothetical protein